MDRYAEAGDDGIQDCYQVNLIISGWGNVFPSELLLP